jgi:hypothetical protein
MQHLAQIGRFLEGRRAFRKVFGRQTEYNVCQETMRDKFGALSSGVRQRDNYRTLSPELIVGKMGEEVITADEYMFRRSPSTDFRFTSPKKEGYNEKP